MSTAIGEVIITRIVLTALNASYSHTPLALYALKAYCAPFFNDIALTSFTINQTDEYILRNLYTYQPDIIGFSCAIWNIEKTVRIATLLRKLLPSVVVIFGGPEVADQYEPYLLGTSTNTVNAAAASDIVAPADIVVPGEGEKPLLALLMCFAKASAKTNTTGDFTRARAQENSSAVAAITNPTGIADIADITGIAGIAWAENGCLRVNPPDTPLDITAMPFPYFDLNGLSHKILYYEASRGCPFRCGYCLSSAPSDGKDSLQPGIEDAGRPRRHQRLRLRQLSQVFNELRVFIDNRVVRVKFTDRTFNADSVYATAIWRFLMEHDNGVTNFHFEIAADLLDDDALALLSRARPGLFQFEIGVQSVNPAALAAVQRTTNIQRLFKNVARIKAFRNIHLHLDLIVGLPHEDFASCQASFNQTYAAHPEQLQLGFLKLLKGAPLFSHAAALGMVFSPFPPYEVLSTPVLSYSAILRLKAVEEMTAVYHNSGRFTHTLHFLLTFFASPFTLFDRLAGFWFNRGYHHAPQSKTRLYEILLAFCVSQVGAPNMSNNPGISDSHMNTYGPILFKDLLRFDLLANENEKSIPAVLAFNPPPDVKRRVRAFTAKGSTVHGNVAVSSASTGHYTPTERLVFFETDIWTLIRDNASLASVMPMPVRHICLCFSYPEPGRQNLFTLAQRVKEIVL